MKIMRVTILIFVLYLSGCGREKQQKFNRQFDDTEMAISTMRGHFDDPGYGAYRVIAWKQSGILYQDIDNGGLSAQYQADKYREAINDLLRADSDYSFQMGGRYEAAARAYDEARQTYEKALRR